MLTQVQIISPTPTGKTERSLGRAAVTTNSVGGRKGVVAVLPFPPSPPSFSSAHTINNLKFNTNLQLLQILPSEGYVCTKHCFTVLGSYDIIKTNKIYNIHLQYLCVVSLPHVDILRFLNVKLKNMHQQVWLGRRQESLLE